MKNTISILLLAIVLLSGCKKYPDGPTVSVIPRRNRIEGKWIASSVKFNNQDSTANYSGYIWEFTYDFSVILQVQQTKTTGVWSTQTNDKDFVIDYDNGSRESYEIRKLKNKEIWLRNKKTQLDFHLKIK